MAFQYPAASLSNLAGNDFYRIKGQAINTGAGGVPSIGPGDLIPIDVGFSAIFVGPESDYEKYELLYLDPTAGGAIQRMPFSKDRPIIGRIAANNASKYPGSDGELGKAYIRVLDANIDGTKGLGLGVIAESQTDIVVYTATPPSFAAHKRMPRKHEGYLPLTLDVNGSSYFVPGYGREVFTLRALANNTGVANVTVHGINAAYPLLGIIIPGKVSGNIGATELLSSTVVPNGVGQPPLSFLYNSKNVGSFGTFDFYRVNVVSALGTLPSDENNGVGFYLSMEVRD